MGRLTIEQWRKQEELENEAAYLEFLQKTSFDGVCPPLCDVCDDVEPDGHCRHGHPSLLLEEGLI